MELNKITQSKVLTWVIIGIAELALVAIVFRAGMVVGFNKANFSYRWGDQYHMMFGGPRDGWIGSGPGIMGGKIRGGMIGQFGKDDFISPHSVVGTVLKVETSTVIVNDSSGVEKSLIISPDTIIRSGREMIRVGDLKVNDRIVVIGSPSSTGETEAKLIRVFNK